MRFVGALFPPFAVIEEQPYRIQEVEATQDGAMAYELY